MPDGGGGKENEEWYSYDYSNAHFIHLNTNSRHASGSPQYNWLVNDLQSTTAEWIFVYHHHPGYNSYSDYADVLNHLVPLYEQYGVDISFGGHLHYYERAYKDGVYYITTGNAGGKHWDPKYPLNPYSQFTMSQVYSFVTVDVDGTTATLRGRYIDGAVFDSVVLSHGVDNDQLDSDDGRDSLRCQRCRVLL
jgi:hypothetical protein